MSIECRLCGSPDQRPLRTANGGHDFLQHLRHVHNVEHPGRLVTRLLEPETGSFTYKRLRAEHEDLYHDPLVNLNPVVSTGGGATTSAGQANERTNSVGGGGGGDAAATDELAKSATMLVAASHLCIVCGQSFASSEEVQCHLIVEHVAAAPTTTTEGLESLSSPLASSKAMTRSPSVEGAKKENGDKLTQSSPTSVR